MSLEVRDGMIRLRPQDWQDLVDAPELPSAVATLPGVAEAVAATRTPSMRVQLDVASERLVTRHHAWLDREAVALLAHVRDEEHQLMAFPPAFLPGALARLTRLGPRRTGPRQPRAVAEELLDDLFHPDDMRRCSAYQSLHARWAWVLATFGGEAELRLAVVEDADGAWLVEPGEDGWQLVPTDATALWRRLTTLLVDTTAPAPARQDTA